MTLHDFTDVHESELRDGSEIFQPEHFTQEILH